MVVASFGEEQEGEWLRTSPGAAAAGDAAQQLHPPHRTSWAQNAAFSPSLFSRFCPFLSQITAGQEGSAQHHLVQHGRLSGWVNLVARGWGSAAAARKHQRWVPKWRWRWGTCRGCSPGIQHRAPRCAALTKRAVVHLEHLLCSWELPLRGAALVGDGCPGGKEAAAEPSPRHPPRAGFVLEFLAAAFRRTAPGPSTEFGCGCFHAKEKLFSDHCSLLARPRAAAAGQAPSVTSCLFAYCLEPVPKSFGD